MTWASSREAREELIELLLDLGPASPERLAREVGKSPASVKMMLFALHLDGVVARIRRRGWIATGKPIPEQFTPTSLSRRSEASARYDHRELSMALGVCQTAPKVHDTLSVRVHTLKGGEW